MAESDKPENSKTKRNPPMEWTMQHDIILCREILVTEPFKHKKGSTERGKLWTDIADNLCRLQHIRFRVSQRAVRERYERLHKKYLEKMREEERASGISPEVTELDALIEEIYEKEKTTEQIRESNPKAKKIEEDRKTAEQMRMEAMERFGETKRRKKDEGCEVTETKRVRRSGNEAVNFLREKSERESRLREEELALKREQQAQEAARQDQLMKQHAEMYNLQSIMLQQQQQQTAAIMSLLYKIISK